MIGVLTVAEHRTDSRVRVEKPFTSRSHTPPAAATVAAYHPTVVCVPSSFLSLTGQRSSRNFRVPPNYIASCIRTQYVRNNAVRCTLYSYTKRKKTNRAIYVDNSNTNTSLCALLRYTRFHSINRTFVFLACQIYLSFMVFFLSFVNTNSRENNAY